jgi:hypothetical protein
MVRSKTDTMRCTDKAGVVGLNDCYSMNIA